MSGLSASAAVGNSPLIGMIWAQTEAGVIGRDGGMPWHLPEDLAHFKSTTAGHPVIMGRRTWESFPAEYRPLPERTNIVVTSRDPQEQAMAGAVVVGSLDAALQEAGRSPGSDEIWIIGGGHLYKDALPRANAAMVTVIESDADGDTFAPVLGPDWKLAAVTPADGWLTGADGTRYRISLWTRAASA